MSCDNNITIFSWNEFPVEKEKFIMCICTSDKENTKINNLINYTKIIFPENSFVYNEPNDLVKYKKKLQTNGGQTNGGQTNGGQTNG